MNRGFGNLNNTTSLSSVDIARSRAQLGVNGSVSGINNPSYRERAAAADRMRESERAQAEIKVRQQREQQAKREAAEREKSKNRWSFTPPSSSSSTTSTSSSTSSVRYNSSSSSSNNNTGNTGFAAKYTNTTKDQSFTAKEAAKKRPTGGGSDDESNNSGKISPRTKRKLDQGKSQPSWPQWSQCEKVVRDGNEYVKIGKYLYTRHALENTYPPHLGRPAGHTSKRDPIGIAPKYIEYILSNDGKSDDPNMRVNRIHSIKLTHL
ncbi:MAG: hypothetical protein EOP45_09340 [Sphingobacteriaceae bacterium]|nr:MAG: hypothetical protein EOP45_09340 [Sphingobacteriaceae bacterium]